METLERIWDYTGHVVSSMVGGFERGLTSLFGSQNQRMVRRLDEKVRAVGDLEERMKALSDEELREQTSKFRARLHQGETLDDILVEAFAVCREGGRRWLGMRHYDVQLIGGMVLHKGAIAEMVTGEGKTLVATLPAYLNAIEGRGVHVITVNDYLARRDMEWMAPLYMGLGLTVGTIQHDMSTEQRQKAYDADITYGTNNEFGFDYLRDNMKPAARGDLRYPRSAQQSQRALNYAIIDEVDNILIDEARTPLIISGPAFDDPKKYAEADRIARQLKKDIHFTVNEKDHTASLTDEGVRVAEKLAGVESFYTAGNMEWPHMIDNALKSHQLYKRDVNYVVEDGKVVIIDEFTGRKMEGRQWSDGLHQAVEAKEGVRIKEETQTLATITLQNYFKLYNKICGMTGTAMTEANEFWKIYKLDVVAIPTNRGLQRIEHNDAIYRTEEEKFEAVADEIERANKWDVIVFRNGDELWGKLQSETADAVEIIPQDSKTKESIPRKDIRSIERQGRPVLIGTVSIEKSERLSHLLDKRGVKHAVLNAKHHQREAEIIAQAGRRGSVTIATNMAGRGTDIVLGGNPETLAWARLQDQYPTRLEVPKEEWDTLVQEIEHQFEMKKEGEAIKKLGGLYVVGTERHESRRIDLQLRGRCGRQGDPGSSRFFLSLEDDLMRIFAGEWVKGILGRLGMQYKERIENSLITRRISSAQKKVEERNFEIRKNLLEYDEVMDEQRKRVYRFRQRLLDGADCREVIDEMIEKQVNRHVKMFLDRDYGIDTFARYAAQELNIPFSNPKIFRGLGPEEAIQVAQEEALNAAQLLIVSKVEENLPDAGDDIEDEDFDPQADWNWGALAKFMNTTFGTNYRDSDLKKHDRADLDDVLVEKAKESIDRVDLTPGAVALEDDYGAKSLSAWLERSYGVRMEFTNHREREIEEIRRKVLTAVDEAYDRKETEFPIIAAIYRYSVPGPEGSRQVDREALTAWASERFETEISEADLTGKQRDEAIELLVSKSAASRDRANTRLDEIPALMEKARKGDEGLREVVAWAEALDGELDAEELRHLSDADLELTLETVVSDRYHPEIRRMERQVLLELIDESWKNHLLSMDRLRDSIRYVGYAQLDPKVEYKREGMRIFDLMWESVSERATDLIFKIEQLPEEFVRSTWVEKAIQTKKEAAPTPVMTDIQKQQAEAIQNSHQAGEPQARRPIRKVANNRPGRNDPCYCGSGKKYKNCHMKMDEAA